MEPADLAIRRATYRLFVELGRAPSVPAWFANCGWDAFGIGAALHVDSAFDTHDPGLRRAAPCHGELVT